MTTPMSITAERTQWATRIGAVWQHSVYNIIETGHLLRAAKADPKMQHGEWGTMVENDLPFNRHTAHKLMQISRDKRLTNVSPGKHLPASWTTLYELTKLDDDTLNGKLRDGTIHPGMRRKDIPRENRTKISAVGKARSKPSRRKKADLAPTLDPRAWSISTPQEREAFVKAVGRRDLEDAFNAVDPGYALTRGSLKEAWNAATPPERLAFVREYNDEITLGWQQKG